jgi:hypothetical protein
MMRVVGIVAAGVVALVAAVFGLLGGFQSPIDSAFRYALEIEAGGQRYTATSVAGPRIYSKPEWLPEFGTKFHAQSRGEGLAIRFPDGRALAVEYPRSDWPRGYVVTDRESVQRFANEGKSYPVKYDDRAQERTQAFIFDDAVAPKIAWRFDWLHPELTLGAGARIVQFTMTPTRDPPSYDIDKTVPWLAIDRRIRGGASSDDVWFGYDAFRAKLSQPKVLAEAKEIELRADGAQTTWLDVSLAFARLGAWKVLVSEVEPIAVRYSDDLTRITALPDNSPDGSPTRFIQATRMPKKLSSFNLVTGAPPRPVEWWAPIVCIAGAGCVDILERPYIAALMRPSDGTVYIIRRDGFVAGKSDFQRVER